MTEQEKKIKRYVNAIERELRLPLKAKARINGDIGTDIHARLEKDKASMRSSRRWARRRRLPRALTRKCRISFFPKAAPGAGCSSLRRYWRAEQHCFPFFPFCFFIFKAPAWALSAVQTGRRPFL